MAPAEEDLGGEAIAEASGGQHWVVALPAGALPKAPRARFAALFAVKPKWAADELAPYLADVVSGAQTAEALLLAHCRCTQASDADAKVYTRR